MTSATRCSYSSPCSDCGRGHDADPGAGRALEPRPETDRSGRASFSRLGLGSLQFPAAGQELVGRLVAQALAGGITAFDTAIRYGPAEEMLGRALDASASGRRATVVAKTHRRTAGGAAADVETSLGNLRRERIEVYMVHDVRWGTDMEQAFAPGGAFDALVSARDRGFIGAVGLSTHRPDVALEAVERTSIGALMIPANIIDRGVFVPAIAAACKRGISLLGMKALGGGVLLPADRALAGALTPEFDCVFVGVRDEKELALDMAVAQRSVEAPGVDRALEPSVLDSESAIRSLEGGFCHGCGYCLPCPQDVPVPEILRLWRLATVYHSGDLGGFSYRRLPVKAPACNDCGVCEERCSFGVPVRKQLRAAHFDLTIGVASGRTP